MTEGVLFTLDEVARTPHLGLLLTEPYASAHTSEFASGVAQDVGMRMLHRFDVEWERYGYGPAEQRELVEFTLRIMLSFFVAPDGPARSKAELRRFIKRWLGGAIFSQKHWAKNTFTP